MTLLSSPYEVLVLAFVIYVYCKDIINSLGDRMMQIMRACVHPSVAVTRKQAFECVVLLKIGSWSFECIIILLIYFLNCWKALFKSQKVSFNKKHKVKSIRLALLRRIPFSAHQLALFFLKGYETHYPNPNPCSKPTTRIF